ncbi:MAG TPA: hypothetical protein VKA80_01890, partial [Beijerinckiaceae bacterium]|nr:hypothetical protein [Beijerinckiaceae bacterium]
MASLRFRAPSLALLACAGLTLALAARAQEPGRAPAPPANESAEDKARREGDLKALQEALAASAEARKRF